jgi:hypothetical protein
VPASDSGRTTDELYPSRVPVLRHVFTLWRWLRRVSNRRNIVVRLLNLPVVTGAGARPGLVLLQIDGLAFDQLQRAIDNGRMPFLRTLLKRERYELRPMYSGLPSTTPAVLGELFYGVAQAVPAYSFRDHRSGEVVEMIEPAIAATIQEELEQKGSGLLEGGSAYSDIYSGGASESQFCPANMGWTALESASAWRKAAVYLLHAPALIRLLGMLISDLGRALGEIIASRLARRELKFELQFLPRRLIGSVLMRELIPIAAEIDATRGLPAMHLNFVGYDECAHRRGPDSRYAHRALPEIDRTLRRIWQAAVDSGRRDYHVWIMADHGQERTTPYDQYFGRPLGDVLQDFYGSLPAEIAPVLKPGAGRDDVDGPLAVAVGPLGSIYWPIDLKPEQIEQIAPRLAQSLRLPIVAARGVDGLAAWFEGRRLRLPDDAAEFLGADHPHLADVAGDFARLCDHPDVGEFLICGYRRDGESISFVAEHGAHGGPGPDETTGFLMLPREDADQAPQQLRPSVVREMGLSQLQGRAVPQRRNSSNTTGRERFLRLVTYNVHSCIGLDGRLSPARIARVLAALDPDVVALQELDVCRQRSGCVDQAQEIAQALTMELHFLPCIERTGEKYGNAVLSRLPMRLIRADRLPQLHHYREPRGALWVRIDGAAGPRCSPHVVRTVAVGANRPYLRESRRYSDECRGGLQPVIAGRIGPSPSRCRPGCSRRCRCSD